MNHALLSTTNRSHRRCVRLLKAPPILKPISRGTFQKRPLISACPKFVLVVNKRVLILDEPEKSLDPYIAYKVLSNILKMPECQDKIIFVVSHLEKIPDDMFNKSIEIKDGKVFL